MYIRKRLISLLLIAAMLAAFLPAAEAAEAGQSICGSISATLRIDYAQSLTALRERDVTVELFQNGHSLGRLPLTREDPDARLGVYPAAVAIRNPDGGALGSGSWPGYLDVTVGNLPRGSYELEVTGRGYTPFRQAVTLDRFDQYVILGTGDASFTLGDVDGSGRVDEKDRDLLANALGSKDSRDLAQYDLNGDGAIDIYDLACVSRNALAEGGAEVLSTALLAPPVESIVLASGFVAGGDLEDILRDNGQAVTLAAPQGQAQIQILLKEPVEMEEIQIRSPEGPGEILAGTVHVKYDDGGSDDIAFDNTLPANIHGISAVPGTGVITISLGRRVAVKEITISVTRTEGGEYASVESIRFLQDIVPENPIQPNSEIKNLKAVPGDGRVSLQWRALPNVSGYRVDYWLRSGGEKRSVQVDVPQAEVTGLDNLKTYLFTVTPIDRGWEGKTSTAVAAEPLPSKAPSAPDMVSVSALDSALNVSWKASKGATYYEVYYKAEHDAGYSQWGSSLNNTGTTLTGLTNGVEYSIYIIAGNSIGRSGPSRIAAGTPKAADYSHPAGIPTEGLLDSSKIRSIRLADAGNYDRSSYTADAPFNARNMIDGDFRTHWTASSSWGRDEHVICTFTEPVDLSAAIWVPRLDGSYPSWLRAYSVRVWLKGDPLGGPGRQLIPDPATGVSDAAGSAHNWPNVPNYSTVAASRFAIMPFGELKDVIQISIAAEQKDYYVVSCSELLFMEYDEARSLPDNIAALFTTPLCTQLRSGVTQADIDALQQRLNSNEGNYYLYTSALADQLDLAGELLRGETSGAVLHGVDSRSGAVDSKNYKQGGSDLQPLGAAAKAGDEVVIYADGIPAGETLTVYASQFNAEANTWRASMGTVTNGRNILTVPKIGSQNTPRGGSLYFTYSGSAPEGISLHVRRAAKIPMLDLSDWYDVDESSRRTAIAAYADQLASYVSAQRINNADKATNCLNVTEIATPTVLLSLPAAAVHAGLGPQAGREQRTETLYQSILAWEDLMHICKTTQGIDKTYEDNDMQTRQNIRCMQMFSGAFMYAAGNHIGIGYGSSAGMVCGKPIAALGENATANQLFGWGIAHEVGHNMDKLGKAEVTNNIYALMAQTYDGEANTLPSRLEKSNKYAAIFTKTAQGRPGDSGDVFVQLGLYWQLHLAYDDGDSPMDFYNRFFKAWKAGTYFNGAQSYQDRVALTASAVANRNLTEFFTRWGMVLSDSTLETLKKYDPEPRAVWYLSDQSRRNRLESKAAGAGSVSLTAARSKDHPDNGFDLTIDCKLNTGDIQGYEILRNGEPIAFVTGTTYTDIVGSANHQTFTYSVKAYDTLGNCFAENAVSQVRIAYDKTVPAGGYTISREGDTVTITLKEETAVSGFKLTGGQRPTSGDFTVTVIDKDGTMTTALEGSFDGGNQAVDDQDSYLAYLRKPKTSDTRIWTYDAKTVIISGIPAGTMKDEDIQLISYAGDDVAFLEKGFVGLLDKPYNAGDEEIPAGALVIVGTYRGDPVYQLLKIQGQFVDTVLTGDENGEAVVKETKTVRDLDGRMYLFAEIPDDGAVSDISDGIFLFVVNREKEAELQGEVSSCAPESLLPAQIKVQSYRTDTPDSAEGRRLTAESLWVECPAGADLPKLVLEGVQ